MINFLAHLIVTAVLLLVMAHLVRGVQIDSFGSALVGALLLGLVNAFVWPVVLLLTLPLTILTLGLFLLVINAFMLQIVAFLVPGIRLRGFGSAFLGALILTLLNLVIESIGGQGVGAPY